MAPVGGIFVWCCRASYGSHPRHRQGRATVGPNAQIPLVRWQHPEPPSMLLDSVSSGCRLELSIVFITY